MSNEQDPRIAPKEMIVTRFKSAQQKRQLREKEQGKGSRALKPPAQKKQRKTKSPVPSQKDKRAISKSPIVIEDDETREYYPDKLKRTPSQKRSFLKPKPEFKMVARTNKRKFNTPRRGVKSPQPNQWPEEIESSPRVKDQSAVYSELSMEEVIRMVEDTEGLDEDDLMEILTCPSPVWWETPPDHIYIEEAICSRKPDEEHTKNPIKLRCFQTYTKILEKDRDTHSRKVLEKESQSVRTENKGPSEQEADKDDTRNFVNIEKDSFNVKGKGEKFFKKNKKLENVLGVIKNKVTTMKSINRNNEDLVNNCEPVDSKDETDATKKDNENSLIINTKISEDKLDKETKKSKTMNLDYSPVKRVKTVSESTEENVVPDDDMLNDLENMEIPVEREEHIPSESDVNLINDISKTNDKCDKNNDFNAKAFKREHLIDDCHDVSNDKAVNIPKDNKIELNEENRLKGVPKNMPPLKKRPTIVPSIVTKSQTDDIENCHVLGTISDTNIKYIDDYSDGDSKDDAVKSDSTICQSDFPVSQSVSTICQDDSTIYQNDITVSQNDSANYQSDSTICQNDSAACQNDSTVCQSDTHDLNDDGKDSYVTVYKIISNEDASSRFKSIPEYSSHVANLKADIRDELNQDRGQLNMFFKKCKNVNRKRCKKIVRESTVCESCEPKSTITVVKDENVKYCLKCSSIFDTDVCKYCLNSEVLKEFVCDICQFVVDSRVGMERHLKQHNMDSALT